MDYTKEEILKMLKRSDIQILSETEYEIINDTIKNHSIDRVNWDKLKSNFILPDDFIFKFHHRFSDDLSLVLDNRKFAGIEMSKENLINLIELMINKGEIITFWIYALQNYKFTAEQLNKYWGYIYNCSDNFYIFRYQQLSEEEILCLPWKWYMNTISKYQKLSAKFIERFQDDLDFSYLKQNLTLDDEAVFMIRDLEYKRNDLSYLLLKHGIVSKEA